MVAGGTKGLTPLGCLAWNAGPLRRNSGTMGRTTLTTDKNKGKFQDCPNPVDWNMGAAVHT